jgi:hypothetical protein
VGLTPLVAAPAPPSLGPGIPGMLHAGIGGSTPSPPSPPPSPPPPPPPPSPRPSPRPSPSPNPMVV